MGKYKFREIEKRWQKFWLEKKVFKAHEDSKKQKYYQLETFPYPSAEGLHVGHPKGYIAEDIHARYMRMKGREVLYTMGWDAFGLPTENYAIKVKKSPRDVAETNIKNFKRQLQMFGFSYDWDREINTSSPEYYKWTQWLFIQLFKKGLAYRAKARVNWCPKDQTVLANEQVVNGCCERCGAQIEEREMEQWFFRITDYADRLLTDLHGLDWPAATIKRQEDWIGRSEGAELEFTINAGKKVKRYILLHGRASTPKDNFYPWLKEELESKGFEVEVPEMPGVGQPKDDEQADFVQKNCHLDEETVVIGHSMGGVVALRLLERGVKLRGVILVATPYSGKFLDGEERATVTTAVKKGFDFKAIKNNTDYIEVISDTKDEIVPLSDGEAFAEKLGIHLIKAVGEGTHFCGEKEPAVLDVVLPKITVFTTRPDTLFGATYMVLAPEHKLIENLKLKIENWDEVQKYVEQAKHKTELMRMQEGSGDPSTGSGQGKTGVELKGVKAVNPATKEEIPVWVADYVLASYGTGVIMAVPAHDERDFEFAKKFGLPIRQVIAPCFVQTTEPGRVRPEKPFVERQAIMSIVKHWKENKYIGLRWKKVDWQTVITGGIEPGQTPEQAAISEIVEETGYLHPKLVKDLGINHSKFFHVPKQENRFGHFHMLYFELQDGERKDISDAEKEIHDVIWLSSSEMGKFLSPSSHKYTWSMLENPEQVYIGEGILVNSAKFDSMDSETAKWEITKFVGGRKKVQYKLRNWSVSRQRYWGTPIPMIYCEKCGIVPVDEKDLPVLLSELKDYRPKGVPPLAGSEEFMKTKCPACGGEAKRDPETLDTFVDSSWYYLRYTDPHNDKEFASKEKIDYWMGCRLAPPKPCVGGVDLYVIGAEHTVLHLLYSRFITKFLHDEGYLSAKGGSAFGGKFDEPFLKLRHQGLILGVDSKKMSKSKGNVVNPDELINEFGADVARVYEMFMGPFEEGAPWDPKGILGVERFLNRFWNYVSEQIGIHPRQTISKSNSSASIRAAQMIHKTIKKVEEDIKSFKFNTAISALMILVNEMEKHDQLPITNYQLLIKLLHPFAPHMAQELWSELGHETILDFEPWPEYDPNLIREETVTLVVQVNGKVRDSFEVEAGKNESEIKELSLKREKVKNALGGNKPSRVIYVENKLINFTF